MVDRPSARTPRAVRTTLSGSARAVAAPARALARAGRPEGDPRWAGTTWLWQPGWGRHTHDRLRRSPTPYGIGLDPHAQRKCATVMDALAGRRFARTLEVGCGEGDLSVRLARHTDALLGVDISSAAVERAATRVPSGTFVRRTLPREIPDGSFDLIVCADVLHYWEPVTLRIGIGVLLDRLRSGGILLAYHHLGQIGTAEKVHDRLRSAAAERGLDVRGHELHEGVGPGRAGARFDMVDGPATPAPGVPAPRRAPIEPPPPVRGS